MKNYQKRTLSLAMAVFFGITTVTGCRNISEEPMETAKIADLTTQETKNQDRSDSDKVMGRYLEEEVPLPKEAVYLLDMVRGTDGGIRSAGITADGGIGVWNSEDGKNWTTSWILSKEDLNSEEINLISVSPSGAAFCVTNESSKENPSNPAYWFIDESGTAANFSFTLENSGFDFGDHIYRADFSEKGKLILYFYNGTICEADPKTGTLGKNINQDQALAYGFFCLGEKVFLMTEAKTFFYDLDQKEIGNVDEILETKLKSYISEGVGYSASSPFVLSEGKDGHLFFASPEGIYSYLPGGTVMEQLVNGELSTLSDPSKGLVSLCSMEDGSFYFLCLENDGMPKLYHYVYSADTPTSPETELKLYTLTENDHLQQLAVAFQKDHPDVYVNIQIGRSGSDAVTDSDALRMLSTDIMAGKGPDILILDELPIASYAEKGLLADVSDIVEKIQSSEGFLSSMGNAFQDETGAVYGIPARFAIPMVFGEKELVEKATDLDSLVSAVEEVQTSFPDYESALGIMPPEFLAEALYDVCSAGWMKEDGSIDQTEVETFYSSLLAMYQSDEEYRKENQDWFNAQKDSLEELRSYGLLGTLAGSGISVVSKKTAIGFGKIRSLYQYAELHSVENYSEKYKKALLNGQASNVFVPMEIYGINSKSTVPETAREFLTYAVSSANQSSAYEDFPTNKKAFEELLAVKTEFYASSSAGSGEDMIELNIQFPDDQSLEQLRTMIESLTTPAFINSVVKEAVIQNVDFCLEGHITPQQAAQDAMQKVNLYLSE